jgi:hypothetical protein
VDQGNTAGCDGLRKSRVRLGALDAALRPDDFAIDLQGDRLPGIVFLSKIDSGKASGSRFRMGIANESEAYTIVHW